MPKKGEKPTEKQLAALRAGKKDFCRGEQRTREIAKKGTQASIQARQENVERRTFAQLLAEELSITTKEGKTRKNSIAKGLVEMLDKELAKSKPNGKTVNSIFVAIRDTIGEMPTQKIKLDAEVKTIGNWRDLPKSTTENENTFSREERESTTEEEPQQDTVTNDESDKTEDGGGKE
ncbi:MAG: hypothetical protein IJY05_03140 [Clostridia bacterium]|nr:hypothetical protein [Clostridia bacterium]